MTAPESSPRPDSERRTWTEDIELAGNQLLARVQELIKEGNVRWLIVRHDGRTIVQIPLTVVAAAGTATMIAAPILAAIGAIAGLLARVQLSIVREGEPPEKRE